MPYVTKDKYVGNCIILLCFPKQERGHGIVSEHRPIMALVHVSEPLRNHEVQYWLGESEGLSIICSAYINLDDIGGNSPESIVHRAYANNAVQQDSKRCRCKEMDTDARWSWAQGQDSASGPFRQSFAPCLLDGFTSVRS